MSRDNIDGDFELFDPGFIDLALTAIEKQKKT